MALLLVFTFSVTVYAETTEVSTASGLEALVPEGTEMTAYLPYWLQVIGTEDLTLSELIISTYAPASIVVTALLDYTNTVDTDEYDETKPCYLGVYEDKCAVLFCTIGGTYMCVIYDCETQEAAYYNTGTADTDTAVEIFKNAMPNNDCRSVEDDDITYVIDALLDSTTSS